MTHTAPDLRSRLVRYADLRPCRNAFIDSRTPGSERKENFTIIGPGVAENPEQHVHVAFRTASTSAARGSPRTASTPSTATRPPRSSSC